MSRIMYLGMRESGQDFSFKYVVINEDLSLGREWTFTKKLFTKGSIGGVFDCELEGDNIKYNKSKRAVYVLYVADKDPGYSTSILFKEELHLAQELHSQAEIKKRNSTKTESKIKADLQDIRELYKNLRGSQKPRFIADLVYQITK